MRRIISAFFGFIYNFFKLLFICIDVVMLEINLRISMALNRTFGRASKDYFLPATMLSWGIYSLSTGIEGISKDKPWIFLVGTLIWYVFVWDSKTAKKGLEDGKYGPLDGIIIFHRIICIFFTIVQLCFLSVAPHDFMRYFAYFVLTYGRYCYLYDIPPRDSLFSRVKSKLKSIKLPNIAPAPSPA